MTTKVPGNWSHNIYWGRGGEAALKNSTFYDEIEKSINTNFHSIRQDIPMFDKNYQILNPFSQKNSSKTIDRHRDWQFLLVLWLQFFLYARLIGNGFQLKRLWSLSMPPYIKLSSVNCWILSCLTLFENLSHQCPQGAGQKSV